MERRALILALTLTLPLALYGVPYAYAATTTTTYVVVGPGVTIAPHDGGADTALCHTGDDVTGGGYDTAYSLSVEQDHPLLPSNDNWGVFAENPHDFSVVLKAWAECQTPITVAGVTAPEFGSLYIAIALGAVAYFVLSRRLAGRPTISTQS